MALETAEGSNNYSEATQKAGEALYIQTGIDDIVRENIRRVEEKLPPYCKKSLEIIVPIVDTVIKQRIEIRYEF